MAAAKEMHLLLAVQLAIMAVISSVIKSYFAEQWLLHDYLIKHSEIERQLIDIGGRIE
jgi:hypothetical protein